MLEGKITGEIQVQACIDLFHNFVPLSVNRMTVFCTKCGTPITYKIEEAK